MKKVILILFLAVSAIIAQDSTRSQVFRDSKIFKPSIFKAKYPSYSLLAGYLLVKEANRGDPFAQHELGIRYLIGQGFPADTVKAVYWIRRAVDHDLASARYNYAILLYNGIGVPWNPFEAYYNFKSAAQAGLPEAQFVYGITLTDNFAVNRNYGEAYKQISKAAKAKYKPAEEALVQFKKSGFIPPVETDTDDNSASIVDESPKLTNPDWNLDYYDFENSKDDESEKKIEQLLNNKAKDLKRIFGLAELDEKININDTTGTGILKFAAENGSPEALLIIAQCYEKGYLFQKNLITSAVNYLNAYRLGSYKAGQRLFNLLQDEQFINLLQDKAKKNDTDAMYAWAGIAALGFNNRITNQQALDFLKSAVNKNHISSMIELGLCYSSGTLVEKNREKAFQYWEMAKNLGSREAQIRIAFTKLADSTNQNSYEENIKVLASAADEGSVLAQTFLGYCYEKGLGVTENKGTAAHYYRYAAQRGNQTANESMKRMYDEIRPLEDEYQIYEAEE
ncbi:MAG: sel1 repeat family protein [Ignavibacteriales bacterium]|nr:sel1 repeat family protein [Ignavibacteriales bacterium]